MLDLDIIGLLNRAHAVRAEAARARRLTAPQPEKETRLIIARVALACHEAGGDAVQRDFGAYGALSCGSCHGFATLTRRSPYQDDFTEIQTFTCLFCRNDVTRIVGSDGRSVVPVQRAALVRSP